MIPSRIGRMEGSAWLDSAIALGTWSAFGCCRTRLWRWAWTSATGFSSKTPAASGQRKIGIVAIGLAPGTVWVGGRDIECLQVRLSPVVAHAVLGACRELGGTVVALDVLWGHDAVRIQEQLRAAGTWADRCGTPTRNSPTRLTC
jgi:hypothetical protein